MSQKSSNQATGRAGENIGEEHLKHLGYHILERNLRSPFGEIDLIAHHQGTLVFVEIKTRSDKSFGFPEEAVTREKRNRLVRLAGWYLGRYHSQSQPPVRFDVLAIDLGGGKPSIRLIQNAIEAEF